MLLNTSISSLSEGNLGAVVTPKQPASIFPSVAEDKVMKGSGTASPPIPVSNAPDGLEFMVAFLADFLDDDAA